MPSRAWSCVLCEEELLSLFQATLRSHKNKSRCQCSTGPVLQSCTLSQAQPWLWNFAATWETKGETLHFLTNSALRITGHTWFFLTSFFTVHFTKPSRGHAWSQAPCSHPQHELLLLPPSPGHCSQTSCRDPHNSCSGGPRAGSNTGPTAAPGSCFG